MFLVFLVVLGVGFLHWTTYFSVGLFRFCTSVGMRLSVFFLPLSYISNWVFLVLLWLHLNSLQNKAPVPHVKRLTCGRAVEVFGEMVGDVVEEAGVWQTFK